MLPRLILRTALGTITAELDTINAPKTAQYFIDLVRLKALDGTSFFRIVTADNNSHNPDVPIHVIQGGLRDDQPCPLAPIGHEPTTQTGLFHDRGALSTARFNIGETYGSFFIVLRQEEALDHGGKRHPDGQGFAVFGQVTDGLSVVDAIAARAEAEEFLSSSILISSAEIKTR